MGHQILGYLVGFLVGHLIVSIYSVLSGASYHGVSSCFPCGVSVHFLSGASNEFHSEHSYCFWSWFGGKYIFCVGVGGKLIAVWFQQLHVCMYVGGVCVCVSPASPPPQLPSTCSVSPLSCCNFTPGLLTHAKGGGRKSPFHFLLDWLVHASSSPPTSSCSSLQEGPPRPPWFCN